MGVGARELCSGHPFKVRHSKVRPGFLPRLSNGFPTMEPSCIVTKTEAKIRVLDDWITAIAKLKKHQNIGSPNQGPTE